VDHLFRINDLAGISGFFAAFCRFVIHFQLVSGGGRGGIRGDVAAFWVMDCAEPALRLAQTRINYILEIANSMKDSSELK
jgi:hypothetical protein